MFDFKNPQNENLLLDESTGLPTNNHGGGNHNGDWPKSWF
jgi:phospholipase C